MRLPRLSLSFVSLTLAVSLALLTGCGKGKDHAAGNATTSADSSSSTSTAAAPAPAPLPAGTPVVVMKQTPETPRPGQFVQHPRGLVAAVWSDGRVVRSADLNPANVGSAYVTGTLAEKERDELLKYLESAEVKGAAKVPHFRLHAATLVTTITTAAGKDKWTTELPDQNSVWTKLRARVLTVPLTDSRPADAAAVRDASLLE